MVPEQELPPELPPLSQDKPEELPEESKGEEKQPSKHEDVVNVPEEEAPSAKSFSEQKGIDLLRDARALIQQ